MSRRLLQSFGIALLALLIFGFVVGAIGSAFFGSDSDSTGFLSKPEVHLPPQAVLDQDAKEAAELHALPPNRFVITNTLLSSWIVSLILVAIFLIATRRIDPNKPPSGFYNLLEAIIKAMYDFVESVAGSNGAKRFFPLFATIFLFVVLNAWVGLLPIYQSLGSVESGEIKRHLLRPAGTDLNMPLALAIVSFVFVEFWGIRMLKWHYFSKFFRFSALLHGKIFQGIIDIFVGILELLSEFVRIISFTFRLFGNMTAGEILLMVTAFLIPFVFSLPFYGLELLVGFIQALIFAGLTLVFVTIAITAHEEGEEH